MTEPPQTDGQFDDQSDDPTSATYRPAHGAAGDLPSGADAWVPVPGHDVWTVPSAAGDWPGPADPWAGSGAAWPAVTETGPAESGPVDAAPVDPPAATAAPVDAAPAVGGPFVGGPFQSVRADARPPTAPEAVDSPPPANQPPAYPPPPAAPAYPPPAPNYPPAAGPSPVYTPAPASPALRPPQPPAPVKPEAAPAAPLPEPPAPPPEPPTPPPTPPTAPPAPTTPPPPSTPPRPQDLLAPTRPRSLDKPPSWGWQGAVHRLFRGAFKVAPSAAELADREARLSTQRGFSRPMTVVVVQPKGGAGKTPTTICLAAALGVRRGGSIVGWDNNETRGTLAVRTINDDDQHSTAWDLLSRLDDFESTDARVGDLGYYVRGQGNAQFDALVSDDNPGNMAQIGDVEFRRLHAVLQRFYRMIIIDTGNNVRSPNWQAAVDYADLVVVVSTYQRDVGYSGSWVLDHLSQTGREELASKAITVLTAAEPTPDPQTRAELMAHFGFRTQQVVEVPYDRHLAEGGAIRWDELSEASRQAWTRVAATVVSTLYARDQEHLTARRAAGR